MEAEHYTGKSEAGDKRWMRIEDYGHTLSAMRASSDVDAPPAEPGKNSPCLEYRMYLVDSGRVDVEGVFSATLNFAPGRGLRYGISFDNEPPQVVTLVPPAYTARDGNSDWEQTVEDNARHSSTSREIGRPGPHTLKVWMVDPGVVIEKIVVNCGGVRPSYLGPPESYYQGATKK